LYQPAARDQARALASRIPPDAAAAVRVQVADAALRGKLLGRSLGAWAADVIEIAMDGLSRLAVLDRDGHDERIHLSPLAELIARGESPADVLLEAIDPSRPLRDQVIALSTL
jgi:glutamate--cysteine ligase